MSDVYSKCGMNCGVCPWGPYAREKMTDDEFVEFRKRAKKILGYQPMQKPCVTCETPDEEIPKGSKLPPRNCLVRKCANNIGVENCACCSRFPCGHVRDLGTSWTREKFEEKHGAPISEEDYLAFVEPFEGLKHLEEIRASLKPSDIVEAPTVPPLETKIVDFSRDLPFPENETRAFRTLHQLLATVKRSPLGLSDTDTYAQQNRLKNRRPVFFRFLYNFGLFGELRDEGGAHLVIDGKSYLANRGSEKTLASWPFVKETIFRVLPEFGVHCEFVQLENAPRKGVTTGTGYLRDKGWVMKLTFDEYAGGVAALKALKSYTVKLNETYGRKAFRYFSDVDMRVLNED